MKNYTLTMPEHALDFLRQFCDSNAAITMQAAEAAVALKRAVQDAKPIERLVAVPSPSEDVNRQT